jgi:Glycosyl transferase family 2
MRLQLTLGTDSVVEITEQEDNQSPHFLWRGSALEPMPPVSSSQKSVSRLSLAIGHDASEGELLGALRNIALLLDTSAAECCAIASPQTVLPPIERAAKYVGLICERGAGEFRLRRPNAANLTPGRVSVLIAAYNPRYLKQALASVKAQSWTNLEIIVCDDSDQASDAIAKIVDEFSRTHSLPVRFVKNPEHFRVRRNYEQCFTLATGEFCKFLNDDDLLEPHCIERMVTALRANPCAHLATSHRRRIDDRGFPLNDQPATQPITREDIRIDGLSLVNALLMLGLNFVGEPSTAMFRTRVARLGDETLIEFLDEFGRGVADIVLWSKLALRLCVPCRAAFKLSHPSRAANPSLERIATRPHSNSRTARALDSDGAARAIPAQPSAHDAACVDAQQHRCKMATAPANIVRSGDGVDRRDDLELAG